MPLQQNTNKGAPTMPYATECPMEFALDQQMLRISYGVEIRNRRLALNLTISVFSKMLDCNEKDLTRLEDGLLYPQMSRIRMQALMLLERLEAREEGRRNGDLKNGFLRRVK